MPLVNWSVIVVFTGHPHLHSDKTVRMYRYLSKNQIRECRLTLSRPLNNNAILARIQGLLPGGPGPLARK